MRSRVLPVVLWLSLAASATGVGLATVSAVRGVVADEPVRVLSASEVEDLLHEPDADLDPIATLTASSSVPRGSSRNDEGRQVDSREAIGRAEADRSKVPTNADDRPSRLGSDPGTLAGTRGGPVRTARKAGLSADEVHPSGGNPRASQPRPSPSPVATDPPPVQPSETPVESPSATPVPSSSATPSGDPTEGSPLPSASPSAPSPTPSGPSPSPTLPSGSPTPTPTPTPTAPSPTSTGSSPASPVVTPTAVRTPPATVTRPPLRFVMRSVMATSWGLPGR